MTSPLYRVEGEVPEGFGDPVLVVSLEGWIDAGFGAATAIGQLKLQIRTHRLLAYDIDELIDMRARRPIMRLVDGVNESLRWPRLQIRHGKDTLGQSLLVMTGPEPDFRWHAFTDSVVEVAQRHGVRLAVLFGAFPAPVPHTRPLGLAATATTQDLADRVGRTPATFEIPAGAQSAIERAFAEAGIPAVGVWARVPHYASSMAFPGAAASILDGLARLTGLVIDTKDLHARHRHTLEQIDALVEGQPDHQEMVRALEAQFDEESSRELHPLTDPSNLPSGDELAAELEKYLREQ